MLSHGAASAAPKTWLITGVSRGLGLEIAKAAIRAGHRVVAAGRKPTVVTANLGPDSDQLLSVELDVTDAAQARGAVDAALSRFSSIDVLVNNAGNGHYGFFEGSTIEDARAQFETNLFGVFNVTWAALPAMRCARKGRIFNISSLGGLLGGQMASLYCATKFALEGFSESLAKEVAPFGLFEQRNGNQPGDPANLAQALLHLANEAAPPMRFLAGSLAVGAADEKLAGMRSELAQRRQLSISTDGTFGTADVGALMSQIK